MGKIPGKFRGCGQCHQRVKLIWDFFFCVRKIRKNGAKKVLKCIELCWLLVVMNGVGKRRKRMRVVVKLFKKALFPLGKTSKKSLAKTRQKKILFDN